MSIQSIPNLVQQLYAIVSLLEKQFPGRKFTLDGHLVGSIGEVIASSIYDLTLLPASTKTHDARDRNGRYVQIKLTQGKSVALRSKPAFLIVLKIDKQGNTQEYYNGNGELVWSACGEEQSNGQRSISLSRLIIINKTVLPSERISLRRS